jgi:hypothetical protein
MVVDLLLGDRTTRTFTPIIGILWDEMQADLQRRSEPVHRVKFPI